MDKFVVKLAQCTYAVKEPPPPIEVVERPLGREKAMGLAWVEDRRVEIDSRLTSLEYLDTLLHELLHIYNPEWSEIKVAQTATEIAMIIWAKDYRRIRE